MGEPEKLLELSKAASDARFMFNALCDEYVSAVASGRIDAWKKCIISYIELITATAERMRPESSTIAPPHEDEIGALNYTIQIAKGNLLAGVDKKIVGNYRDLLAFCIRYSAQRKDQA